MQCRYAMYSEDEFKCQAESSNNAKNCFFFCHQNDFFSPTHKQKKNCYVQFTLSFVVVVKNISSNHKSIHNDTKQTNTWNKEISIQKLNNKGSHQKHQFIEKNCNFNGTTTFVKFRNELHLSMSIFTYKTKKKTTTQQNIFIENIRKTKMMNNSLTNDGSIPDKYLKYLST